MLKKIILFIGAGLISVGCFLPVLSTPGGKLILFDKIPVQVPDVPENAMIFTGVFILILAISTFAFTLLNKTKFIWINGILTGVALCAFYIGFHIKLKEMKEKADEQIGNLFGNMFKGVADSLFATIELTGLGWYFISAGAFFIIIAAFVKTNNQ